MAEYGIEVYDESGVITSLTDFRGGQIYKSIRLVNSSDVRGEFVVPQEIRGIANVFLVPYYYGILQGDKFFFTNLYSYNKSTGKLSWNFISFSQQARSSIVFYIVLNNNVNGFVSAPNNDVYGVSVNNTNLLNYKTYFLLGRFSSDHIFSSPKSTLLEQRKMNNYGGVSRMYSTKFPSGDYLVFSRDREYVNNLNTSIYEQRNSSQSEINAKETIGTNSMVIDVDGTAYINGTFNNGVANAKTDFYVFKKTEISDQKEYGISIFDNNGDIVFTSAGEPLLLYDSNLKVHSPIFVDPEALVFDLQSVIAPIPYPAVLTGEYAWVTLNDEIGVALDPFVGRYGMTAFRNEILYAMSFFVSDFDKDQFSGSVEGNEDFKNATFIDVRLLENKPYASL